MQKTYIVFEKCFIINDRGGFLSANHNNPLVNIASIDNHIFDGNKLGFPPMIEVNSNGVDIFIHDYAIVPRRFINEEEIKERFNNDFTNKGNNRSI